MFQFMLYNQGILSFTAGLVYPKHVIPVRMKGFFRSTGLYMPMRVSAFEYIHNEEQGRTSKTYSERRLMGVLLKPNGDLVECRIEESGVSSEIHLPNIQYLDRFYQSGHHDTLDTLFGLTALYSDTETIVRRLADHYNHSVSHAVNIDITALLTAMNPKEGDAVDVANIPFYRFSDEQIITESVML